MDPLTRAVMLRCRAGVIATARRISGSEAEKLAAMEVRAYQLGLQFKGSVNPFQGWDKPFAENLERCFRLGAGGLPIGHVA